MQFKKIGVPLPHSDRPPTATRPITARISHKEMQDKVQSALLTITRLEEWHNTEKSRQVTSLQNQLTRRAQTRAKSAVVRTKVPEVPPKIPVETIQLLLTQPTTAAQKIKEDFLRRKAELEARNETAKTAYASLFPEATPPPEWPLSLEDTARLTDLDTQSIPVLTATMETLVASPTPTLQTLADANTTLENIRRLTDLQLEIWHALVTDIEQQVAKASAQLKIDTLQAQVDRLSASLKFPITLLVATLQKANPRGTLETRSPFKENEEKAETHHDLAFWVEMAERYPSAGNLTNLYIFVSSNIQRWQQIEASESQKTTNCKLLALQLAKESELFQTIQTGLASQFTLLVDALLAKGYLPQQIFDGQTTLTEIPTSSKTGSPYLGQAWIDMITTRLVSQDPAESLKALMDYRTHVTSNIEHWILQLQILTEALANIQPPDSSPSPLPLLTPLRSESPPSEKSPPAQDKGGTEQARGISPPTSKTCAVQ